MGKKKKKKKKKNHKLFPGGNSYRNVEIVKVERYQGPEPGSTSEIHSNCS